MPKVVRRPHARRPDGPAPAAPVPRRRAAAAGALVIAVLTLVAYLPALGAGFIWDDDDYVTENPHLRDVAGLGRIWIPGSTHQYYPLVFTTFWLEHQVWGLRPAGYHLVNVVLHAATALLLWRALRELDVPGAWMIGAVFALHPVHVESVAWVTERKNVLSGMLYVLAVLAYLRFDARRESPSGAGPAHPRGAYALSLLLFALALLSKSVTCSLPAALILVMVYRRDRLTPRRLLPLLPMFVLGAVAALHTAHLERTVVGAAFDHTFPERLLVASRALLFYPVKLLLPWPLMFVYPRWTIDAGSVRAYVPVAIVLAIGTASVVAFARGRRGPFVALAFSAGTILPALGFVDVYPHQFSFVADHFQYLASIGVIALVVAPVARRLGGRRWRGAVAALVLAPLAVLTWTQSATYRSAETVWRDTLHKNDEAWLAHNNLSGILLRQAEAAGAARDGRRATAYAEEARHHASRAAALREDYHLARSNHSEALRLLGRLEEAVLEQQRAIDIVMAAVESAGASRAPRYLARNHYQLGRLHHLRRRYDDAAAAYRAALDLDPGASEVAGALARVLVAAGRLDEAAAVYARIIAARPDDAAALASAAAIAERRGEHAAAAGLYARAVDAARTPPDRAAVLPRAIRFLVHGPDPAYRDLDRAAALAEQLVRSGGGRDPGAADVLASVYAEAGRLDEAITTAETARDLARRLGLEEMAARIEARLRGYRQRRDEAPGPAAPDGDG